MKTLYHFLATSLFLSIIISAQAADTLNIQQALLKKRISVAARGNGGLGDNSARLIIKNLISADLNIQVPAGLMLHSEDQGAQDLIILEESIFMVKGRAVSGFDMFGACTQASNYAPKKEEKYMLGEMAQDELIRIVQIVNENNLQSSVGQAAVWAFTDGSNIDNVFHPDYVDASWDLANIIAVYRQENPPTREEIRAAPRPTQRIVFSARADMVYHAPRDMKAELALYDSAGNMMRQYFPLKSLFGGVHIYTIGVNNILDQETAFYVRLKDKEGNVLKEMSLSNNQPYEEVKSKRQKVRFEYIVRQNSTNTMTLEDVEGNLIQELAKNRKESMSKRNMNLELIHAFPAGKELQIKVTNQNGEVIHTEQIVAN